MPDPCRDWSAVAWREKSAEISPAEMETVNDKYSHGSPQERREDYSQIMGRLSGTVLPEKESRGYDPGGTDRPPERSIRMAQNQRLIVAIDKVIDALEELKIVLREETGQEAAAAVPEAFPFAEKEKKPQPEITVNEVKATVFHTAKTMTEAARSAAGSCQEWTFQDDEFSAVDFPSLLRAAGMQDMSHKFGPEERGSYYIVTGEGAIGVTENDSRSITWLYIPSDMDVVDFPFSLAGDAAPGPGKEDEVPGTGMVEERPAARTQSAPAGAGKICPACGKTVSPGVKFCIHCGTSLASAAAAPAQTAAAPASAASPGPVNAVLFCTACGARLRPGDRFCLKCGTRL